MYRKHYFLSVNVKHYTVKFREQSSMSLANVLGQLSKLFRNVPSLISLEVSPF